MLAKYNESISDPGLSRQRCLKTIVHKLYLHDSFEDEIHRNF